MIHKEDIGTLWVSDSNLYVAIDDIVVYTNTKISYATGETHHSVIIHVLFFYESEFGKEIGCLEKDSFLKTYKKVGLMTEMQTLEKIFLSSQSY